MPLYEYRCEDCDHSFEVLQRMGQSAAELACPECGADGLEKQYSTFASTSGTSSGTMTGAGPAPAGGCCQGTFT